MSKHHGVLLKGTGVLDNNGTKPTSHKVTYVEVSWLLGLADK